MKKRSTVETTNSRACVESKSMVWRNLVKDRYLYLMLLPAVAVTIIFAYIPLGGSIMAFQDFDIFKGFLHSEWVGLDNFIEIFTTPKFSKAIFNTLAVSILNLVIGFPLPIILSLLINELRPGKFKKITQTISYMPHFLSMLSCVGLVYMLFGRDGIVNDVYMMLGGSERIVFLAQQELFIWFLIGVVVWRDTGWSTVIHLATISSINPELYEAASIDGATRWQKARFITLPHMKSTCVILLIFQMGTVFNSNFALVYGLQNPYIDFEVISTIVYQTGIKSGEYSLSTALGFAQGIVSLILVGLSNWVAKKMTGSGIV